MEVACPSCAARYTADAEKLRGKSARMRCRACDTLWVVSNGAADESSEKRAAVVKRGADREKRDLFATRPTDHGSIKQTLLPPPSGVAARNENSVLFTVDAVRSSEKVSTMHEPAPASSRLAQDDDEGVIDLMALSSRPPPPRGAVAPLFGGPVSEPPTGFVRELAASSSGVTPLSKIGAYKTLIVAAAAAVLFLVVGTIGVSAIFSEGDGTTRALVWQHIPSPKLANAPPPAVSSEPEETSSTPDKHGKKGKARGPRGASAAATKTVITSKTPYVAPPPPPKAADTCGCHGDFNCILRCSAKGK
jgi:predicted Zn finger-like uncharacterized protein